MISLGEGTEKQRPLKKEPTRHFEWSTSVGSICPALIATVTDKVLRD